MQNPFKVVIVNFYINSHQTQRLIKSGMNASYNNMISSISQRWPYKEAKDYYSFESILAAFPHLKDINLYQDFDKSANAIGVIIRSANDDNVHKAIKYGIWTTTPRNKSRLQSLWHQKSTSPKTEVYLFFSVVKSGMFEGVARLTSGYHQESFPLWWQNQSLKFKGFFDIEWLYIKDVNYKHLKGLYSKEGEDVTKSKDCDLVDSQTTVEMLQIFNDRPTKRYIFDDFAKMDDRQKNYTRKVYEKMASEYQQYQQTQQQQYYFYSQSPVPTNYYPDQSLSPSIHPAMITPATNFQFQSTTAVSTKEKVERKNEPQNAPKTNGLNPSSMTKPVTPNVLDPKGANCLGFQMNPVSKNRKK